MDNQSLTPEDCKRICDHMNKDHKNALLIYAKHYAAIEAPLNAEMSDISSEAMYLRVDSIDIKITFKHRLKDSKDAHQTLVDMLKI